jgi:hypothetical protein
MAGCTASPGSIDPTRVYSSPLTATFSWFRAINEKIPSALITHAAPNARDMMNWNDGMTSQWPEFSKIQCSIRKSTHSTSDVLCTFNETAPPGNNLDSFWTVALQHEKSGRWLITNYGQG